jgi:hypothetical protein
MLDCGREGVKSIGGVRLCQVHYDRAMNIAYEAEQAEQKPRQRRRRAA